MHTPKVVEVKELSDQFVAYKICCCGDNVHASWHTIALAVDDHEGLLATEMRTAAELHEKKTVWRGKHPNRTQPA